MASLELSTEMDNSTTDEQPTDQQPEKKPRKRLKKICSQIRNQMEFYFSDANLSKDGFVKNLIDEREDRYVPVIAFSNFNKLRELTTDMKLVLKALSTSTKLEVSEDKQHIRRKSPYIPPKDVDERTIYVEGVPKDADRQWLQQTFAQFGKVLYVSLPCYRTSGDLKGFGFVEFEKKDAAEKACHSYQPVDPDDKMTRFPKYNKQLQSLQKQISSTGERIEERKPRRRQTKSESSSGGEGPETITSAKRQKRTSESSDNEPEETEKKGEGKQDAADNKSHGRKRAMAHEGENSGSHADAKRRKPSSTEDAEPKPESTKSQTDRDGRKNSSKKRKRAEESDSETENKPEADGNTTATKGKKEAEKAEERTQVEPEEPRGMMIDTQKRKRLSDVSESEAGGETREVKRVRISELVDVKENVEVTHKKRRNKKKKKKEWKGTERMATEEGRQSIKVIPKQAWLQLRKEYLNLQRSSMKALKKTLQSITKQQTGPGQEVPPLSSYLSTDGTEADGSRLAAGGNGKLAGLQFTSGVIIKIDASQPCTRKELKDTLSLVAQVPYVDFQDGDQHGFVRCATPEDALRVVASRPATFGVSLLQGDEESEYWTKINTDRDQKRASKTRNKKRGTQKLMDRAEKTIISGASRKHVVFDD